MSISSNTGDEIVVLGTTAQSIAGEHIGSGGWRYGGPAGPSPTHVQLIPQLATSPAQVSLTLKNGALTNSGKYRFVRTGRIDVLGEDGSAKSAEGVVVVETGSYKIEQFTTGGVSRPR